MDESQFWELVQRAHNAASDDMDRKCEVLKAEIEKLSKNEASDFAVLFDAMMDRAYSHKLWGAAYVIHGGCSDDTFNDFRSSLISRGRACFERAIAAGLRPGRQHPDRPSGEDWAEDDLRELFPRLSTKFM